MGLLYLKKYSKNEIKSLHQLGQCTTSLSDFKVRLNEAMGEGLCRIFRNLTSYSIKPWYHCPRDGGRAEMHKKTFNSKINQREIQLRRRWGSSAKNMHNSVISTVQLRGVSRSSLTVLGNRRIVLLAEDLN